MNISTAIYYSKKLKFAISSAIATTVDHVLFVVLVHLGLGPGIANLFSQGLGMVVNFLLQKEFIFKLCRPVWQVFLISLCFSLAGLIIGSSIVHMTTQLPLIEHVPYLGKVIATCIVFLYNYFTKRYAFEKR